VREVPSWTRFGTRHPPVVLSPIPARAVRGFRRGAATRLGMHRKKRFPCPSRPSWRWHATRPADFLGEAADRADTRSQCRLVGSAATWTRTFENWTRGDRGAASPTAQAYSEAAALDDLTAGLPGRPAPRLKLSAHITAPPLVHPPPRPQGYLTGHASEACSITEARCQLHVREGGHRTVYQVRPATRR
jgi:hypothetical protein